MKKIIFIINLFLSANLFADLLADAAAQYKNGNEIKACELYSKACDDGNANGCRRLGTLYSNGEGVRKDKKKASELYGKACNSGDNNGCWMLGFMYNVGDGVKQDKIKASELFSKACNGGYANGCRALGLQ
ncbi:MAG: tetratricopeptide repeat protein [Campylobacterales bacterium]|nr:tetratricopeptide repeat protein [Campylobacterales bacterium]